jgi:hypothetical protein
MGRAGKRQRSETPFIPNTPATPPESSPPESIISVVEIPPNGQLQHVAPTSTISTDSNWRMINPNEGPPWPASQPPPWTSFLPDSNNTVQGAKTISHRLLRAVSQMDWTTLDKPDITKTDTALGNFCDTLILYAVANEITWPIEKATIPLIHLGNLKLNGPFENSWGIQNKVRTLNDTDVDNHDELLKHIENNWATRSNWLHQTEEEIKPLREAMRTCAPIAIHAKTHDAENMKFDVGPEHDKLSIVNLKIADRLWNAVDEWHKDILWPRWEHALPDVQFMRQREIASLIKDIDTDQTEQTP